MPHLEMNLSELEDDQPVRVELDGTGIVVVRHGDAVRAFEDECPHAGWRLSEGEVVDGVLECPGHAWQFNVDTGECADVPSYCLTPVRVMRDGDTIRLELTEES